MALAEWILSSNNCWCWWNSLFLSYLPCLPCQVQIHWEANEALLRKKTTTTHFSHNMDHNVPQNSYFVHMQILADLNLYFHSGNQKLKTNICIYIYIGLWKLKLSIKGQYTYRKTHTSEVNNMLIFSISTHCNHHPDQETEHPQEPSNPQCSLPLPPHALRKAGVSLTSNSLVFPIFQLHVNSITQHEPFCVRHCSTSCVWGPPL